MKETMLTIMVEIPEKNIAKANKIVDGMLAEEKRKSIWNINADFLRNLVILKGCITVSKGGT